MKLKLLLFVIKQLLKYVEDQGISMKIDDNKIIYTLTSENVEQVLKEIYELSGCNLYLILTKRFSISELN